MFTKIAKKKSPGRYQDYLSVVDRKARKLTIDRKQTEVTVTFAIFNELDWDISIQGFMGSARLDASIVSRDLKLTQLLSTYQFAKGKITPIQVRFNIKPDVLTSLEDKESQKQRAYWSFDLQWRLRLPLGGEFDWKPSDILFEEIPRIANY